MGGQMPINVKQPQLNDFPPPIGQQDDMGNNYQSAQDQNIGGQGGASFTEDEIQNLRDIFDLFDKDHSGKIEMKDLEAIMTSLQRDPNEAKEMLRSVDPNHDDAITFEEFLQMMQQVENKIVKSDPNNQRRREYQRSSSQKGVIQISPDSKVLDFLRLLEEYRRKCEDDGNYAEAKKARSKFDELLKKETVRQKNNIRAAQEHELQNIEAAQKAQFLEFSQAWDNYMSDYEATAYLSLEKLKEKHMLEFQQFQEKIRKELRAKMKFSKDLLELRDKEAKLVKMKRYEEAEKVKMKADLLEEFERNKLEAEMQAIVEKKESKLRHTQQLALAALLKRIQRDRNEQLKHRQQDSQRLIQRNKNILNDLLNKQNSETKKTLEHLKQTLGMTKMDMFYEPDAGAQKKATNLQSMAKKKKSEQ
ncbi:ca2+-binding protein (ef-hand superfamily) [Stylonychia lemnae]|uniref:Ca2+-binding protein (Ef-hand superfamily) n=1 Tax=Stylonychia lemnae TaxID=5949 RepID=A0A078B4J3_STYLE|nr:ca2+-binding protein (ef-hand superfamily) [Stylonychia lemnae]|eukprot:CDW89445.1 ca2+-binding protein (ef-hand superfamily) [Stylonychia lemnae]